MPGGGEQPPTKADVRADALPSRSKISVPVGMFFLLIAGASLVTAENLCV